MTIIGILCLTDPQGEGSKRWINYIPHFDKIIHVFLYFILSWLLYRELNSNKQANQSMLIILLTIITYGFLIEIGQKLFTNTRSFEIWDIASNIAGFGLFFWAKKWRLFANIFC